MLYSSVENAKGKLWEMQSTEGVVREPINKSKYMTKNQFQFIRSIVPFMAADKTRKDVDPWWQVVGLIEARIERKW